MATWEIGIARVRRREPTGVEVARLLAAGLLVAVVAWAPYSVLRGGSGPVAQESSVRPGALEVPPAVRPVHVVTARPPQALAVARSTTGHIVLAFGRFQRRATAEARARLVRRKGYIARVVPAKAAYLVVSRPYRNPADAQFWSAIFNRLGLQATAMTQLEAIAPQSLPSF